VLDEIRQRSFVPVAVHKEIQEVRKAYERLTARHGQPPQDEELARETGKSTQQLYETMEDARRQHFLSIHGMSEESPALAALAPAAKDDSPESQVEQKEMLENLAKAITQLPEKERLVILLYYERELTMKESAMVLGVTESRVSQLHAAALFKLSEKLRSAH
jgi:RNA polymerase sigma factor FliA